MVLKPGNGIIVPIHAFHHDERYFPDPEKFDPERFSQENKLKIKPYTYLPFGDGPRICIGKYFLYRGGGFYTLDILKYRYVAFHR